MDLPILIRSVWLRPGRPKIYVRRFLVKMKVKRVCSLSNMVLLAIVIVLGFALYKSLKANHIYRDSLPYLAVGEEIDYFDLTGMDAAAIDASVLKKDKPSLIFIFSRPCSPCNKNIVYWKKMAEVLKDKVHVYGIILGQPSEAYNFSEDVRLNFDIYVPENVDEFIRKMRVKLNFSQTIVYHEAVRLVQLGNMEGEEAVSLIKFVKDLI